MSVKLSALACLVLAAGCSWNQVLTEAHNQTDKLRYTDNNTARMLYRWQVPSDTYLQVRARSLDGHIAPEPWLEAAQAGLDRAQLATSTQPKKLLVVVGWPTPEELSAPLRRREIQIGALGVLKPPSLAARGTLQVVVQTEQGDAVNAGQLQVAPKLWGQHWHHPQQIEAAFFELAATLR